MTVSRRSRRGLAPSIDAGLSHAAYFPQSNFTASIISHPLGFVKRFRKNFSRPLFFLFLHSMGFCLTRCVCENTIAMARREVIAGAQTGTGFSIRHTDKISIYAKQALASIVAQAKATEAIKRRIAALARKNVTTDIIKRAMAEIYPATPEMAEKSPMAYSLAISRRHEVIAQWEGGETAQTFRKDSAWKLVNAFTFPIFNPSKMSKGTDASGIRYDGIFGDRAERVARIFETVEKLAA